MLFRSCGGRDAAFTGRSSLQGGEFLAVGSCKGTAASRLAVVVLGGVGHDERAGIRTAFFDLLSC